jgi:hypothetical protein
MKRRSVSLRKALSDPRGARDVSPTLDQYLHAKRQGADRIGEAAE